MTLTQVTVTATFRTVTGIPASGSVTFIPTPAFANTSSDIVVGAQKTVKLVDGGFTVDLYATDDPETTPTGATYTVIEKLHGNSPPRHERTYIIEIPHDAAGGTIDLADLIPLGAAPSVYIPVPGPQGEQGETGPEGDVGPQGPQGAQGDVGPGVVAGGTTGQMLVKASDTDYDTEWATNGLAAHEADTTAVHGIADTSALETTTGAQAKADDAQSAAESHADTTVSTHAADTTSIHGIADTSVLETTTGSQTKATAAQTAAEATAATALATHEADSTNVHGIANTAALETTSGAQSKANAAQAAAIASAASSLTTHEADTTNVHGITDMAALATGYLPITGNWYGPIVLANVAGVATNNLVRGGLLRIERTVTVDRIRAEVTSAGTAGSVVRLGIYRMNAGLASAALVLDAGTIDGTSATIQELTISQSLTPGVYALIAVSQGTPSTHPTMRRLDNTGSYPWQGAQPAFLAVNGNISGDVVSGALPGSTAINPSGSTAAPIVQVRIA